MQVVKLTGETITDEQIRALRVSDDPSLTTQDRVLCSIALEDLCLMPMASRIRARARIAEILNARAKVQP